MVSMWETKGAFHFKMVLGGDEETFGMGRPFSKFTTIR